MPESAGSITVSVNNAGSLSINKHNDHAEPPGFIHGEHQLWGFQFVTTDDNGNYQKETRVNAAVDAAIKYAQTHQNETPILVFDSIDKTTLEIMNELIKISSQHQIGEIKLPENLRIVVIDHASKDAPWRNVTPITKFITIPIQPE